VQIGHQPVFGVIGTGNHLSGIKSRNRSNWPKVSSRRIKASRHIDKHRRFKNSGPSGWRLPPPYASFAPFASASATWLPCFARRSVHQQRSDITPSMPTPMVSALVAATKALQKVS
jgi:hypothetical protein